MNPKQALETAAYNYIANLATPFALVTNVYKGIQNTIDLESNEGNEQANTREMPCVTVVAEGAHSEAVVNTLLFQGILAVSVEAIVAHTTDADFAAMCEEVFDAFGIEALNEAIGLHTSDFSALEARVVDNGHAIRNGANWENTIRIAMVYGQADM